MINVKKCKKTIVEAIFLSLLCNDIFLADLSEISRPFKFPSLLISIGVSPEKEYINGIAVAVWAWIPRIYFKRAALEKAEYFWKMPAFFFKRLKLHQLKKSCAFL